MQGDAGAARRLVDVLDAVAALAAGFPAHALVGVHAGAAGLQGDLVGNDEGRVETHAELADQRAVLGLVAGQIGEEFLGAGAGDRADGLGHFLTAHADAVVLDGDRVGLGIHIHANAQIRILFVQRIIAQGLETQLFGGIRRIRNQLAQEDFLVAVKRTDHQVEHLADFCLKIQGFLLGSDCHGQSISSVDAKRWAADGADKVFFKWTGKISVPRPARAFPAIRKAS